MSKPTIQSMVSVIEVEALRDETAVSVPVSVSVYVPFGALSAETAEFRAPHPFKTSPAVKIESSTTNKRRRLRRYPRTPANKAPAAATPPARSFHGISGRFEDRMPSDLTF